MKTKTIKTDADLLEAIQRNEGRPLCELIFKDGTVIGARIGAAHLRVDSYSFTATAEIDREEVKRHRVKVEHPNFPTINRYFETSAEANEFARPYRDMPDITLDEQEVTVQLDATGKVIAEVDGTAVKPLVPQGDGGDDIPF